MEEQIPNSQVPPAQPIAQQEFTQAPVDGRISLQDLEQMKARARELAIQQTLIQQRSAQQATQVQQPQVVYVRRNLTVAELLLVLLLSTGLVAVSQVSWNFISTSLPKIEVKIK